MFALWWFRVEAPVKTLITPIYKSSTTYIRAIVSDVSDLVVVNSQVRKSFLKPLLFTVLFGCTYAGIVSKIVFEKDVERDGYKRGIGFAPEEIMVVLGKGVFILEMTPFKKGKDTLQKLADTRYYVRLYWRDTNLKDFDLDLLQVDWPVGTTPSIAVVRSSIQPVGIEDNEDLIVKYLKKTSSITRTFFWQSNTYKPKSAVEGPLA